MTSSGHSLAQDYSNFDDDVLEGRAIPEGDYEMRVRSAQYVMTPGGKHAIKTVMEILSGPKKGKTFNNQLTWSPETDVAVAIFNQSLKCLGAPSKWIKEANPSWPEIASRIQGAKASGRITVREFGGRETNNVNFKSSIGAGAAESAAVSLESQATSLDTTEAVDLSGTPAATTEDDPWATSDDN